MYGSTIEIGCFFLGAPKIPQSPKTKPKKWKEKTKKEETLSNQDSTFFLIVVSFCCCFEIQLTFFLPLMCLNTDTDIAKRG